MYDKLYIIFQISYEVRFHKSNFVEWFDLKQNEFKKHKMHQNNTGLVPLTLLHA